MQSTTGALSTRKAVQVALTDRKEQLLVASTEALKTCFFQFAAQQGSLERSQHSSSCTPAHQAGLIFSRISRGRSSMTLSATNLLQVANLLQATNHVQETNELLSGNQQTQPTPSFSPTGFPFSLPSHDVVMVTITSAGADHIYYTADGSAPTPSSTEYSGPVTVDVSLRLKAIATRSGFNNSAVGVSVYELIVQEAAFGPPAGTYTGTQTVTITVDSEFDHIWYTTDGSFPVPFVSPEYTDPISVATSETIQTLATKTNWSSGFGQAAYTIN
jgi:hypothetical protein